MSDQYYKFDVDHDNAVIKIFMRGFWPMDTVKPYFDAKQKAIDDLLAPGTPREALKILIDVSEWEVQHKEVAEYIAIFDHKPDGIKTAVVNRGDALHKMQSKRIATKGYQFFPNKEDAIIWLES